MKNIFLCFCVWSASLFPADQVVSSLANTSASTEDYLKTLEQKIAASRELLKSQDAPKKEDEDAVFIADQKFALVQKWLTQTKASAKKVEDLDLKISQMQVRLQDKMDDQVSRLKKRMDDLENLMSSLVESLMAQSTPKSSDIK